MGGSKVENVLDELRLATAAAHARLERATGLGTSVIERGRLLSVLTAMFGFHAIWEPAVAPVLGSSFIARRRLPILRDDLRSLGLNDRDIDELPRCHRAAQLARNSETALGSLYVIEGSTLGGKVISRVVSRMPDVLDPVVYFDPYGARTGEMWKEFRRMTQARIDAGASRARTIAAAIETFEVLESWVRAATERPRDGRSAG
jgi:heme oxygenase